MPKPSASTRGMVERMDPIVTPDAGPDEKPLFTFFAPATCRATRCPSRQLVARPRRSGPDGQEEAAAHREAVPGDSVVDADRFRVTRRGYANNLHSQDPQACICSA